VYVLCIPRARSLSDLQHDRSFTAHLKPPAELRESVRIAVVDDQPFAPENNLRNNHFQISTYTDIHKIEQLQDFPIVLCDLQGVGLQLAADMQGAYLIEEVKRNYPDKAVIAFTGGSASSNIAKRAAAAADDYLRKDASIEDWRDVLDKHIRNLSDPIYVWKQFRVRLVHAGITPLELLKLEHAYVTSVKTGATATKGAIEEVTQEHTLDPAVKKEIAGFIASKSFELLFEALKGMAG
jgi:CheY-like chemotaxis protein